ncbi:MAG TPA: PfkB family carbohydrate kinase [Acidimicrobiales bacterium]|nr:PfkB family carbohydrate kinase [Acidimicrobiales bacterium]
MSAAPRFILVDSVVVDVVLNVDALPERGSDTLVERSDSFAGGGFNVMAAASRLGLAAVYGGVVGLGPFATIAQTAMREENIVVATAPNEDLDTGFVVAMVEDNGERTFLTSTGAEATLSTAQLDELDVSKHDFVYFSGYALLHESNARALLSFLKLIPAATCFLFDPGPIVSEIPESMLEAVFNRVDWFSCNAREVHLLTDAAGAGEAACLLRARMKHGGAIVRTGADGCVVAESEGSSHIVPGFPVDVVDSNGAGDCHVGAFAALLAAGFPALEAARRANAAAAISVTKRGPATAPTKRELEVFLSLANS